MSIVNATLADVPLLVLGDVSWTFTPGVQPFMRTFLIHRDDLDAINASRSDPNGVELRITGDEMDDFVVRKLFILRVGPTGHPQQVAVVVADVRWQWRYHWLLRRYNIKRRTGNRSFASSVDTVLKAAQFATDDLKYAPFSLRPDTNYTVKWEMRDVVRDVFGTITGFTYVDSNAIYANAVEVQGLELDDDGANAAARVLGLLPGAQVRIDEFGIAQIYNSTDGSEEDLVKTLGAPFVGSTLPEPVSQGLERPSKVHVHFTCEDELRFDFVEGGTRDTDGRWLRNVMPLPCTLTFTSGSLNGKTLPIGTWVEITDDLCTSFAAAFPPLSPQGKALPPYNLATLRQTWCNGGYNAYFECLSVAGSDPVWANFIKGLRAHYRQTFQVNQRWADRIVGYLPKRVSLIDPLNNVWGAQTVYTNYAIVPSYRRIGKTDGDPTQLAYNRVSFPTASAAPAVNLLALGNPNTTGAPAAQAELKILDQELGIFRVDFFLSPQGDEINVVPAAIEGYDPNNSPTAAGFQLPSAAVDGPLKVLSHSRMKSDHALSIVVTVLTGAPNTLAQTWDQTVTLHDAKHVLPSDVAAILPDAFGPEMHIHVGPAVQTARFAWSDTFADKITNAILGIGSRADYGATLLVNDEIVLDIANAQAAQIYSTMIDHTEGEPVSIINPDLHPQGRVAAVEHGVRADGIAFTKVRLPAPRPAFTDIWGLLPEFARRIIRRLLPR